MNVIDQDSSPRVSWVLPPIGMTWMSESPR